MRWKHNSLVEARCELPKTQGRTIFFAWLSFGITSILMYVRRAVKASLSVLSYSSSPFDSPFIPLYNIVTQVVTIYTVIYPINLPESHIKSSSVQYFWLCRLLSFSRKWTNFMYNIICTYKRNVFWIIMIIQLLY